MLEVKNNLKINNVWINRNPSVPNGVLGIDWSSDQGFGRYEIIIDKNNKLHAYTECMDNNEDKSFSQNIFNAIINSLIIDE